MGSSPSVKEILGDLNKETYVSLLSELIGETEFLQNSPPKHVPEEDRIVNHVMEKLLPFSTTSGGGPLIVNHVSLRPDIKRGSLIVEYPGTEPNKIVSFVGMHMDVVPADRSDPDWQFDPFSLSIVGDRLQGRGTTDCLGHVALISELMKKLGQEKPKLRSTVYAVFIANEEDSSFPGISVDDLKAKGYLDKAKYGPLYWIDTSDKQPCIGTAGMIQWNLTTTGKTFHSGMPDKAINPLELSMEALKVIQTKFYDKYPAHEKEAEYKFTIPSTMKPTQWSYPGGGVNQIPAECTISGDVRLTPFYDIDDVLNNLQNWVDDINENVEKLDTRGPVSKYVLPEENLRGKMDIEFPQAKAGVACDLKSVGYKVLERATKEVVGFVDNFSLTGSLPLIRDLQDEGYDVQCVGYGLSEVYHANNEYCLLSDMAIGYKVFASIISQLEYE